MLLDRLSIRVTLVDWYPSCLSTPLCVLTECMPWAYWWPPLIHRRLHRPFKLTNPELYCPERMRVFQEKFADLLSQHPRQVCIFSFLIQGLYFFLANWVIVLKQTLLIRAWIDKETGISYDMAHCWMVWCSILGWLSSWKSRFVICPS